MARCGKGAMCEFTFKELRIFLFGKKVCKECNVKMNRYKNYTIKEGIEVESIRSIDIMYTSDAKVRVYSFMYKCPNCNYEISLSEMANKEG